MGNFLFGNNSDGNMLEELNMRTEALKHEAMKNITGRFEIEAAMKEIGSLKFRLSNSEDNYNKLLEKIRKLSEEGGKEYFLIREENLRKENIELIEKIDIYRKELEKTQNDLLEEKVKFNS
jgi:predicted patatin/cPLA2 family phospholipase